MSANERHETVLECIQEGAEDYLLKPVTKKVVQCIWQHVWRRQQQQQLPALPSAAVTHSQVSFFASALVLIHAVAVEQDLQRACYMSVPALSSVSSN